MSKSLLDYLPAFLHDIREYAAIMTAEQPEINAIWAQIPAQTAERFVDTASEVGIAKWESVLDITPSGTDILEDRRFRVKSRLLDDEQMSYDDLLAKLTALCGEGNFVVDYQPDLYKIAVKVALRTRTAKDQALAILDEDAPADFEVSAGLLYITHGLLSQLTHNQMHTYMHTQLREDEDLIEILGG